MEEMMSHQERQGAIALPGRDADGEEAEQLRQRWYRAQRRREQQLRHAIERLYQHHRIQRQEAELAWHREHDLFSEESRKTWGVSKRYLATAGFGAGAMGGLGVDALTLGHSFGAAALLGGVLGAAGSLYYADRLALPVNSVLLGGGRKRLTFGPVQDSQFGYILLGRAVDHWWHISQRNHAGRDLLELEPADHHWLERLARTHRQAIQATFERCRKQKGGDVRTRERLVAAIAAAMAAYDDWRLNRGGPE
jgi:hypothetical protein